MIFCELLVYFIFFEVLDHLAGELIVVDHMSWHLLKQFQIPRELLTTHEINKAARVESIRKPRGIQGDQVCKIFEDLELNQSINPVGPLVLVFSKIVDDQGPQFFQIAVLQATVHLAVLSLKDQVLVAWAYS